MNKWVIITRNVAHRNESAHAKGKRYRYKQDGIIITHL